MPSVERVRAVCGALGLAFYVGPPRPATRAGPLARAAGVGREKRDQLEHAARVFAQAAALGGDPVPDGLRGAAARCGGT